MDLPNLTKTEALIIEMLLAFPGQERFGLDLVESSGGRLKRGTVYVLLDRLEDKKYVESRLEANRPGEQGKPRRMYRVTGLGIEAMTTLARMEAARAVRIGGLIDLLGGAAR
jgi:DNA-binding MarR family transcriptional regulator